MSLTIPGLGAQDQDTLTGLLNTINDKSSRNRLRRKYYDHKAALRDLGIAIPPALRSVETVVGWPAKGVDVLSRRLILEGFTGANADSIGLSQIWDENRMEIEAPQAHTSALIHSTAFLAVTAGDVTAGEPAVLLSARSAQYATGEWSARTRSLSSALTITATDGDGQPTELVLYVPNRAVIMRRTSPGRWDLRQVTHDLGVPVEAMPYKPQLDRPFGTSRISRAVMALTDSAVRTLLRTEVSAEFYNAPQRYVLGADEDAFVDAAGNPVPAWQAVLGRLLVLGKDEDGDTPTVDQFAQQSMQPNVEQLRSLAAMFAAETNLSLSSLGIVQDNPSSAEAMQAAERELITEAEFVARGFGAAWTRQARTALRMVDDSPAARVEYARLRPQWRRVDMPSMAAAADATMKLVASGILPPDSEVTYDGMNLSEGQRVTLRQDVRRARAVSLAASLAAPEPAAAGADEA